MRKKAAAAALLCAAALSLPACGRGETMSEKINAKLAEAQDGEAAGEQEEAEEADDSGEKAGGTVVYENFSSGVLYEDGEYYFAIDSMEMTEEGYVITYRAATDTKGYKGYYDMLLRVNGISFDYDDFTFVSDAGKGNSMLGTGRDSSACLVISNSMLENIGATEVNSLHMKVVLGHNSNGSIYEDAELEADLYPGAAVDAVDCFPEPARESWVLVDDDNGRLQITNARCRRDEDGNIMNVTLHFISQGNENGYYLTPHFAEVNGIRTDAIWHDTYYWLNRNARYYKAVFVFPDSIPKDSDLSQASLELGYVYSADDQSEDVVIPVDLSGIAEE